MEAKSRTSVEQLADLLDVHVLDVVAEIEALLRGIREVQRDVLRFRGVPLPSADNSPMVDIQDRLEGMLRESDALRDAIVQARDTAIRLSEHA